MLHATSSTSARAGTALSRHGPGQQRAKDIHEGRGRTRLIGDVRCRFIEAPVLEQGCRDAEVAAFLGCHASNVSRALKRAANAISEWPLSKYRKSDMSGRL